MTSVYEGAVEGDFSDRVPNKAGSNAVGCGLKERGAPAPPVSDG
jgi:hypothetical protein